MRPQLPPVPGLNEAIPALVASLDDDLSSRNVMRVAEALWRAGHAPRAIELLAPLTERDRSAIAPFVLLGWCYEDTGEAAKAQRTFEMVRELDPANPFARLGPIAVEPVEGVEAAGAIAAEGPAEPGSVPGVVSAEDEAEPEPALTEEELREVPPGPLYSRTLGRIFEKQGFDEKARQIFTALKEEQRDPEGPS